MSGISSEWERHYQPSREFIRRLEAKKKLMEKLRRVSNRKIARELYRIAEEHPHCSMVCCEAAERLGCAELTEVEGLGEN